MSTNVTNDDRTNPRYDFDVNAGQFVVTKNHKGEDGDLVTKKVYLDPEKDTKIPLEMRIGAFLEKTEDFSLNAQEKLKIRFYFSYRPPRKRFSTILRLCIWLINV